MSIIQPTATADLTRVIVLSIKSLEQQTRSVSLPRNASVLELKHKIQVLFDIDGTRQRLIFQGRVLKDDKNLLDYENLDDGKVIHLVVRPIDAPRNPDNDEPSRNPRNSRPTARQISEEYAVITLDASLADLANGNSLISAIMNNLLPSISPENSPFSPRQSPSSQGFFHALRSNNGAGSIFNRSSYDYFRQGRRPGLDGLLDVMNSRSSSSSINLPIPSSVEMRLSRTLSYMREIRTLLDSPVIETDINRSNNIRHSSLRAIRESREILRSQGSDNHAAQVSLVVEELADLMTLLAPWLRDMGQSLRTDDNGRTSSQQLAHVLRTARIIQILSLINHFLGSVLSSAETSDNTASTSTETWSPINRRSSSTPLPPPEIPKRKREDDDSNSGEPSSSSKKSKQ